MPNPRRDTGPTPAIGPPPLPVAEPGEPGYPTPELPDGDPWAPAVNQAIREIRAQAWAQAEAEHAEYLDGGAGPDPETQ